MASDGASTFACAEVDPEEEASADMVVKLSLVVVVGSKDGQ
jgi:hypothetical protein